MKEHLFNLHDVFLFISMAVCLLLSLFQWLLIEHGRERSLLAAFLLSLALSSVSVLFLWNTQVLPPAWFADGLLPYLLTLSLLAHGPLLYLYIRSLTRKTVPLSVRDCWHLLPLLLVWLPMIGYGVGADAMRMDDGTDTPPWVITRLWDFIKIQPVFYAGWCLWLVVRYQKALRQEYSHYSRRELVWLFLLAGGFMANWVWTLAVHWIAKYASIALADQLGIVDNYVTFVLLNALFIYSLVYAQSMLVTQHDTTEKPHTEEDLDEQAVNKVRQAMEVDRLYLEQNVNIEGFASRINLPVRTVSAVINKHFNSNFFEFINGYRVEAAKNMLSDPACDHQTILDILLAAGFNSKSAFHRFFSRLVGMSPSEFRKQSRQP